MVDFKRLVCDGFVKSRSACHADAVCYFESESASRFEFEEDDSTRDHYLCENCFKKLFPNATVDDVEEAKEHMLKHK
jgi:hypothetical protein